MDMATSDKYKVDRTFRERFFEDDRTQFEDDRAQFEDDRTQLF